MINFAIPRAIPAQYGGILSYSSHLNQTALLGDGAYETRVEYNFGKRVVCVNSFIGFMIMSTVLYSCCTEELDAGRIF